MVCLSAAGTLCALPAPAITIDADLKDWSTEGWVSLTDWAGLGSSETTPPAAADLSAQLAARWDAGALYLAVKVTDDSHNNLYYSDPCSMENGDSVQVAFDVAGDQGDELDDTDDYVYGWGVAGSGIGCRWWAPSSAGKSSYTFAVKRAIPSTTYEVRLPAADLGLAGLVVGKALGFAARVNESDIGSYGRDGFLAWQGGSGEDWDPSKFGVLKLSP